MEFKDINENIGHKNAICVFAVPIEKDYMTLFIGRAEDKESFLEGNPACAKWALWVEPPKCEVK